MYKLLVAKHVHYDLVVLSTDPAVQEQFVDHMMRNLTSETVFLLTTFVNMASACSSSSSEEVEFINQVVSEIFRVGTVYWLLHY